MRDDVHTPLPRGTINAVYGNCPGPAGCDDRFVWDDSGCVYVLAVGRPGLTHISGMRDTSNTYLTAHDEGLDELVCLAHHELGEFPFHLEGLGSGRCVSALGHGRPHEKERREGEGPAHGW